MELGQHRTKGRTAGRSAGGNLSKGLAAAFILTLAACGGDDDEGQSSNIGTPNSPTTLKCDQSIVAGFKPDAQTTVLLVKAFKKGDALLSPSLVPTNPTTAQADLCLVKLLVGPGNPGPEGAPSTSRGIGIEVWLPTPTSWNGRFHATAHGGWAGGDGETNLMKNGGAGLGNDARNAPLIAGTEGAVTASTDTGHIPYDGSFAMNPDGSINTPLWNDFSSRGIHEMAVKAKALTTAYYGSAPKKSYWDGTSTGGRQALKQAQEYPNDFDGIIAAAPAINWTKFITAEMYPQIVVQRDLGGSYMTPAQLNMVTAAAISSCDFVGGKHLGYILDPTSCRYDPTKDLTVLCSSSGGTNATASCVSTTQANAINKMWYGMTSDGSVPAPTEDVGFGISPSGKQRWFGTPRGSSLLTLASPAPFPVAPDLLALILQDPRIGERNFLNAVANGQSGWKTLSYSDLSNVFDLGVTLNATSFAQINTDDPDLSAFKARGGKLIHLHGWSDDAIPASGSINYYERVIARMGGINNVRDFHKLFMVPGYSHIPSSPGQIYSLLTDWTEQGIEPSQFEFDNPTLGFKNLVCQYPQKPTYRNGDSLLPSSYVCS